MTRRANSNPATSSNTGRPGASVSLRWFGAERPLEEEDTSVSNLGSVSSNSEDGYCQVGSEIPDLGMGRVNERISQ